LSDRERIQSLGICLQRAPCVKAILGFEPTLPVFRQVTIIAPGLLGASLGMACRERHLASRLLVWARRPEARASCLEAGWCDAAPESLLDAVRGSDLLVLCPPVAAIVPLVEEIAPALAPGALLTDVGSTKGQICAAAPGLLPPGRHFVGAHPMAGSEKSGMEHADAGLFAGRPCFITPATETDPAAVARIEAFWQAVGMRIHRARPEEHDALVAHVSHLPHLVATALSVTLGRETPGAERLAGGGLRDTTRVAAGSPPMWRAICEQNRDALLGALEDFRESLGAVTGALERNDFDELEALLEEGRQFRLLLDPPPDA
jgi:cyclohexadieny/prephenate dehydrogenase